LPEGTNQRNRDRERKREKQRQEKNSVVWKMNIVVVSVVLITLAVTAIA
jgi:hypothetical protein